MIAAERPEWLDQLEKWHVVTFGKIILVIVIAIVTTWVARRIIRRTVRGMHSIGTTIGHPDPRSVQRARTISAVLRSVTGTVIWSIAVIAILSLLGVNIAAFVTVSSIIGAALAFGAQQIVRDLLAGFFMFTEDQYGVGDSVDLGLAEGVVEEVSLRVTRLRGGDGKVWYVPHGQIQRVANLSQEWFQVVIDVPLPRDADLAQARNAIEEVGASVQADPDLGPSLLERPKVLGVEDAQDDRILLRLAVRVTPSSGPEVRRALQAGLVAAVNEGRLPAPPPGSSTIVLAAPAAGANPGSAED